MPTSARRLLKSDLKRLRKDARDSQGMAHYAYNSVVSNYWYEYADAIEEAEKIGFTASRREEAYTHLQTMLDQLYKDRRTSTGKKSYSLRYIYNFLVEELAPYGFKDKRSADEIVFDETFASSYPQFEKEWKSDTTVKLEQAAEVLGKEPINLTDDDLVFLKDFTPNPYGRCAPEELRAHAIKVEAFNAVEAMWDTLAAEVQILLGGQAGMASLHAELHEGHRSGYSSFRINHIENYQNRYRQASDLLARELEARWQYESMEEAFAQDAEAYHSSQA